jgi:hypothetical protein
MAGPNVSFNGTCLVPDDAEGRGAATPDGVIEGLRPAGLAFVLQFWAPCRPNRCASIRNRRYSVIPMTGKRAMADDARRTVRTWRR